MSEKVNLKKESDKREERIESILKSSENELLDNMKLMDGDLIVIESTFNKKEIDLYQYDESYEGIFIYISGVYPYEEYDDIISDLKVNIIKSVNGIETYLYSDVFKSKICRAVLDIDNITWENIKRDIITHFVKITDKINQFKHVDKTSIEYIGNIRAFDYEGEQKLLNLMKKWRYNHNNISPLDIVGIENIKIKKSPINIGDVYEYKNVRLQINKWEEDKKAQSIYRALKNLGFTESQTKELISKYLNKLEAVIVGYCYTTEGGYETGRIDRGYQPMLLGLGITSIEKLIGTVEFKTIWYDEDNFLEVLRKCDEAIKEVANNKDSEAIKKVPVFIEDEIWKSW